MKIARHLSAVLLGVLFSMPCALRADDGALDMINRIYIHGDSVMAVRDSMAAVRDSVMACDSVSTVSRGNVYLSYFYDVGKRNAILYFVPSMWTVAKGARQYSGETFGRMWQRHDGEWAVDSMVHSGNARRYDRTMPLLFSYIKPRLYDETVFREQILSPFNRRNAKFYRYEETPYDGRRVRLSFTPRTANTQLVRGSALVDVGSAAIVSATFSGEYDMLRFDVDVEGERADTVAGRERWKTCEIRTDFHFAGNEVNARMRACYDCADSLRQVVERHSREAAAADTLDADGGRHKDARETGWGGAAWDFVGDHLLTPKATALSQVKVNISPLINPLSLGYSKNKGLSYNLDARAYYEMTHGRRLSLDLALGYSFKNKQIFFTAPLRYTFDKDRRGWVEMTFANGNRIADSRLLERIKGVGRDTLDFEALDLHYFGDMMMRVDGNYSLTTNADVSVGAVYHRRTAVNKRMLEELGSAVTYTSFAPTVCVKYKPFARGPLFTGIYERGIKGIVGSDIEYEKYEFDASFKSRLSALSRYSLRFGGGFYTNSETTYFVDFVNFHENYLLHGWDDDWEGQFQLLHSQWYNASKYYVRFNASYESPLMWVSHLPLLGRIVETERLYFSALQIEDTRPYVEVGYAFTNRFFSAGVFGGIVGTHVKEIGCKFSFELFRRW